MGRKREVDENGEEWPGTISCATGVAINNEATRQTLRDLEREAVDRRDFPQVFEKAA
jgi:hypothetical protein